MTISTPIKEKGPTASETIRNSINSYVKWVIETKQLLPTKGMIYKMLKVKYDNEPYLFNENDWGSAFGTSRSMLSELCLKKLKIRLDSLLTIKYEGVDYFYNNEEQIYFLALCKNTGHVIDNKNITEHTNIQYQLASIFTKIGYQIWVPKNDSNGQYKRTKYGNTILESFNTKMVDLNVEDVFYWIDFVVYDNGKPILQIEVEESTGVLGGMDRMYSSKCKCGKIKSIVTSTNPKYEKKVNEYGGGAYKSLRAKFMDAKKIETIFNESLKVSHNDEKFKKLVFKEFGI